MSATLEVKYFNSFWIKKMKSIVDAGDAVVEDLVPGGYDSSVATPNEDWYIEEARIRGGYNNTSVDFGVKAYLVEEDDQQQHRFNSMINNEPLIWRVLINPPFMWVAQVIWLHIHSKKQRISLPITNFYNV